MYIEAFTFKVKFFLCSIFKERTQERTKKKEQKTLKNKMFIFFYVVFDILDKKRKMFETIKKSFLKMFLKKNFFMLTEMKKNH